MRTGCKLLYIIVVMLGQFLFIYEDATIICDIIIVISHFRSKNLLQRRRQLVHVIVVELYTVVYNNHQ